MDEDVTSFYHEHHKVNMPKSNTTLIWTPMFEWYVVWCGSKNWHPKEICLNEIGLRAQNMLTILGSRVNMIGGTYMTTKWA